MATSEQSVSSADLRLVRVIADYQFGPGVGEKLFPEGCEVKKSAQNRLRGVSLGGVLLCTFGRDSLINLAEGGARRLAEIGTDKYVVAADEAVGFVRRGRSLFAKHVVGHGEFYAGEEVIILDKSGRLVSWGRALWSSYEMSDLSGVPVIRQRGKDKDVQ